MGLLAMIGKKIGTTHLFQEDGSVVGVTAVQAGPCTVTQVKAADGDGYAAVQLGFEEVKRLNRPERGHLRRAEGLFRHLREVGTEGDADLQVGQRFGADVFQTGEKVDTIGVSRGRGFQGGVRRHGFAGGPKTHGQTDRHRAPGAIGSGTFPGRVIKGVRMAGHMGAHRVTARNLVVVRCDPERNLLFLKGAVPGPSNGLVIIRKTKRTGG